LAGWHVLGLSYLEKFCHNAGVGLMVADRAGTSGSCQALLRERLLSILVGGSKKGDGIRAVNSKSNAAQGETATRAAFVKCVFSQ
jgi:hypothetical protein